MTSKQVEHFLIENDFEWDTKSSAWNYKGSYPAFADWYVQENPESVWKQVIEWLSLTKKSSR